ncbi:MAG: PTS transporter subunit EIIC [Hungatella sp.]
MKQPNILNRFIDLISRIFGPVIPSLTAAGVLKGLLALAQATGVLKTEYGTYQVLNALADGFFYYLPVFLAYSGATAFGANPYTGAAIALALLYPDLTRIFTEQVPLSFLKLPVVPVTYASSILPILLSMALLGKVEPWLKHRMPELIRVFAVPLCAGLIVFPATLLIFGPIGAVIGAMLANLYQWLYAISPMAAGVVMGAGIQPMVICGFHWSIFPICLENINRFGEDTLMPLLSVGIYAQAGAAFAVMLWAKDKKQKTTSLSAGITALFGTTEPALFGFNIPLKKPFLAALIGAGIGGGVVGFSHATAKAFVFPNIVTLPVFMGEGFGLFVLGNVLALVLAFGLTLLMMRHQTQED